MFPHPHPNNRQKVEIYPPINAPGFQYVACGLTAFCVDAAGELAECSIPWPRFGDGNMLNLGVYPSKLWAASACCVAAGIGLLSLTWLYTLVACFGCFREKLHRLFLRVLELGGVCLAAGLICFGFTLGDTGVNDDRCFARNDAGVCEKWYATLPSQTIEGGNASCSFCPQTGQFQMSTACSFGWGGLAVIIAVVLSGIAAQFGTRVTPRRKQVKYRWVTFRSTKKKKTKTPPRSAVGEGSPANSERGTIEHTGERVCFTPPDIVNRLNEIDAEEHGDDDHPSDLEGGQGGFVNIIPGHLRKSTSHSTQADPPPPLPPISSIPGRSEYSPTAPGVQPVYAEIAPDEKPSVGPVPNRKQSLKLADGAELHEISETDLTKLMGSDALNESSETDPDPDELPAKARLLGGDALNESSDTDPEQSPRASGRPVSADPSPLRNGTTQSELLAASPPIHENLPTSSPLLAGSPVIEVNLSTSSLESAGNEISPIPPETPGAAPSPAIEEADDYEHPVPGRSGITPSSPDSAVTDDEVVDDYELADAAESAPVAAAPRGYDVADVASPTTQHDPSDDPPENEVGEYEEPVAGGLPPPPTADTDYEDAVDSPTGSAAPQPTDEDYEGPAAASPIRYPGAAKSPTSGAGLGSESRPPPPPAPPPPQSEDWNTIISSEDWNTVVSPLASNINTSDENQTHEIVSPSDSSSPPPNEHFVSEAWL